MPWLIKTSCQTTLNRPIQTIPIYYTTMNFARLINNLQHYGNHCMPYSINKPRDLYLIVVLASGTGKIKPIFFCCLRHKVISGWKHESHASDGFMVSCSDKQMILSKIDDTFICTGSVAIVDWTGEQNRSLGEINHQRMKNTWKYHGWEFSARGARKFRGEGRQSPPVPLRLGRDLYYIVPPQETQYKMPHYPNGIRYFMHHVLLDAWKITLSHYTSSIIHI